MIYINKNKEIIITENICDTYCFNDEDVLMIIVGSFNVIIACLWIELSSLLFDISICKSVFFFNKINKY